MNKKNKIDGFFDEIKSSSVVKKSLKYIAFFIVFSAVITGVGIYYMTKDILSSNNIDKENTTSNKFTIDVGGDFDEKLIFNYMIDINNLKLISSDYKVKISSKLISEFTSTELPVTYWIALEKSSVPGV